MNNFKPFTESRAELAKAIGVTHTYISKIENDALENPPSLEVIERMADYLDITAHDLALEAGQIDWSSLKRLAQQNTEIACHLQDLIDSDGALLAHSVAEAD